MKRQSTICLSVLLAAACAAGVAAGSGSRKQLVVVAVPLDQTVTSLRHGKFVQRVTCRRACRIIARTFISPRVAKRLGFRRVQRDAPFAIGLKQARIRGGRRVTLRMPVSSEAKRRLRKLHGHLELTGSTYAQAIGSAARGQANWVTTLRPR